MNKRNSDVLVIGAGMSGLVAALAAARRGRKVTVLSRGVGALAIGSGCVDVLGYVNGQAVISHQYDAYHSGYIGFTSYFGSAKFENIVLRENTETPPRRK